MTSAVQQIASNVLPSVAALVSAVFALAFGAATKWLMSKAKTQTQKDVIKTVTDAAAVAVRDVSNTVFQDIKKDGIPLTPEERQKLKDEAFEKIKTVLGSVSFDSLRASLGFKDDAELAASIKSYIESEVYKMKIEKLAAAAATPVVTAPVAK